MLNPKPTEKMIDTAAGSCGFPMHSIFHVWKQLNPEAYNLFTTKKKKPEETEYVQNNVFGIDFSEKSVRVGRMLNIIAGDGHTNVIELNSLDFKNWDTDYVRNTDWYAKYGEGFQKLAALRSDKSASNASKKYKEFLFDILMANPPFAGDLDNYVISSFLLSKYGKMQTFRETTGNVQPNLFLYKIREIMIPEFSDTFQKHIERLAVKALEKRNLAQAKYSEAEALLLQELDMDFWQPEEAIQLRKECKYLLEQTKLAVETAIEQGEDKAFPL